MLRQLNHTIIALVTKFGHPPSVADYRPIPRCNVICKVITKIIADRLSPALEHLIDSSQAAFVGGRTSQIITSWLNKWFGSTRGNGFHLVMSLTSTYRRHLIRSHRHSSPKYSTGLSSRIPRERRWPRRKFAIRRRTAVRVSGISNPGTLSSLPEFYGTFIARQTPYGLSGSMRFTFGGLVLGLIAQEGRFSTPSTTCRDSGQDYY
ncbi:UNVERIFIED_CONTAM: hypothetical protein Sangu_2547200 [Sesamum angustifolium]|uniref:Reverse transcriptase domain-containing protein n=1 Tax=Sesamum angustifolium TaxID=2727405 RepID=A0AAW2JAD0_9LAMI